jgi:alkylated DNA repair dioxygenase AlkB
LQPRSARTPRASYAIEPTRPNRILLAHEGWVAYDPDWLPHAEAQTLLSKLQNDVDWQQGSIRLFGKQVLEPRLIGWAGEAPYRYSGRTLPPRRRPQPLARIWALAEEFAGVSFNHVLMNRYRDGQDYMGWHSDDEPELGPNPPILSVSLGATRRFLLKPKPALAETRRLEWRMTDGALLFMAGSTQHHYVHSVPRERSVASTRLNLTFRRVLRPPPDGSPTGQRG